MTLKIEEIFGKRADRETLIETKYIGDKEELKGTEGEAWLDVKNNQWYYKPFNSDEPDGYRVHGYNLSCNDTNGWIKCEYVGTNTHAGKFGKASFDEKENVWIYRPKGSKDDFRITNESSLKFIRDVDVVV